ncbi:hypothetical protein ACFWBB_36140 [Streptomyces sp. NPDC060000]|uniref:hypothetical protein n=1 Tax=Streptomyces sp. NPDC060000 TaxID=3347031 RepID=UPI0036C07FB2
MGKYTFPPGAAYSALAVQNTPVGDDTRAGHQVTEPLLREFLALLEAIQEDLDSRWNGQEDSSRHAQRAAGTYFHES